MDYYNEIAAFPARWLQNLQVSGHIPPGKIDERSICDVAQEDLEGVRRAHFFAGIGGWPLALKLAGWPEDREVWTGSCPCQPFSVAGGRKGVQDKRHLWPEFFRLIRDRRPAVVFGEQVAGPAGLEWLAGVRSDLETLGYAVGAADLCAAGVGAPHRRQRLYWVGHSAAQGLPVRPGEEVHREEARRQPERSSDAGCLGDSSGAGLQVAEQEDVPREGGREEGGATQQPSRTSDFWSDSDLIPCQDKRSRRIEPGTFPLAHGIPGRVGQIRSYGNAIVPQVAAVFIRAYMESRR